MVLAFLADVGDITRFKNVRGFNGLLRHGYNREVQRGQDADGSHYPSVEKTCATVSEKF